MPGQAGSNFNTPIKAMQVKKQIQAYIASEAEPKRSDMQVLHELIQDTLPGCKLWFLDGKNNNNKVVSNPNIGYGLHTLNYADGKTREFYKIGLSANKTGISVYIMGLKDKTYLAATYGKKTGQSQRERILHQIQIAQRDKQRCAQTSHSRRSRRLFAGIAPKTARRLPPVHLFFIQIA